MEDGEEGGGGGRGVELGWGSGEIRRRHGRDVGGEVGGVVR